MADEVYIKKIELTDTKKALIKSKWKKHERLEVEIYIAEDCVVYCGSCSQEIIRKKKKDINVEFDSIKNTLVSVEILENISYELDENNLKFTVVAQENFDSDVSFGSLIYLKVDLKKVELTNLFSIAMQTVDDMIESLNQIAKLKTEQDQYKEDLKVLQELYEQAVKDKEEFDKTIYKQFNALLTSKKKRISELEHKLEKLNQPNKFLNLSSDLDQSSDKDHKEAQQTKAIKAKSKTIFSSQSSDDAIERQQEPSTSKSYKSPARRKINSRNNTPKSGSKNISPMAYTQRGTPKKLNLSPRKPLFQFNPEDSDDSDDLDQMIKKPQPSADEDMFSGLSFKITQKDRDSQEMNPSSAELLIPSLSSRKRSKSLSLETSENEREKSADFVEPAQRMEMDIDENSENVEKNQRNSNRQSPKEPYTQKYVENEIVENSQTIGSPSIFDSPNPKVRRTTDSISTRTRFATARSNFSVDTINVLLDDSI